MSVSAKRLLALVVMSLATVALVGCTSAKGGGGLASTESVSADEDARTALTRAIADLSPNTEITFENSRFDGSGYSMRLSVDALAGQWPGDAPPVLVPAKMRLTGFTVDEPELDTSSEEFREMGWAMLEEYGLQDEFSPDDLAETYQYVRTRVAPADNPSAEAGLLFHCFQLGGSWYFFQDA